MSRWLFPCGLPHNFPATRPTSLHPDISHEARPVLGNVASCLSGITSVFKTRPAAWRTYGQLVHVEEFHIGVVRYRIAVFRVQGGLHGRWSCDTCLLENEDDSPTCPTIDECVAKTKKTIEQHHLDYHSVAS